MLSPSPLPALPSRTPVSRRAPLRAPTDGDTIPGSYALDLLRLVIAFNQHQKAFGERLVARLIYCLLHWQFVILQSLPQSTQRGRLGLQVGRQQLQCLSIRPR